MIAKDWLTRQTSRAVDTDGSLKFRADQEPDHLGLAAMQIACGEDSRLFSEVYAEVTDHESPLSDSFLQNLANKMIDEYYAGQD